MYRKTQLTADGKNFDWAMADDDVKHALAIKTGKLSDFTSVIPILPIAVFTLMSNKSEALMTQFMQS